jgi:leader peptidase (prepilin peptidase) / N-methyltransferase
VGEWLAAAAVLAWLTALSVYDVRHRRLPNLLTLPGAVLILGGAAIAGHGAAGLLGAAALGVVHLVVHLAAPAAMGAGDVKLALGVGGLTGAFGPDVWLLGALAAPVLTGVLAVGALLRGGPSTLPHGPSMCVAAAAAVTLAVAPLPG